MLLILFLFLPHPLSTTLNYVYSTIKLKGGNDMAFGGVVLGSAISAIVGIIGLLVYVSVYAVLNLALLDASVTGMLAIIPVILAAVIVVSIVVGGFAFVLGGRL